MYKLNEMLNIIKSLKIHSIMYEGMPENSETSERPIYHKLPYSPSEKIAVGLSVSIISLHWIYILLSYNDLPATIPVHWNFYGKPDSFQSKELTFMIPSISLVIFILSQALSNYPHKYNYPVKITHNNAKFQYILVRKFQRSLIAGISLLLFVVSIITLSAINNTDQSLSTLSILIIVGFLVAIVTSICYYRALARRYV